MRTGPHGGGVARMGNCVAAPASMGGRMWSRIAWVIPRAVMLFFIYVLKGLLPAMKRISIMRHRHALLAIAVFVGLALGVAAPVRSGGIPDEEADQEMPSKAIVGFVKDATGNTIANAKVVITFKTGNTQLIMRSDATGHFRLPGFRQDVAPDSVELACSKDGYRQTASIKRPSTATSGVAPIEIDCVLTPE
jgi:hypothetical protein